MNSPPRRQDRAIALLIPGLTGGGAEKVIVRMANYWAARDYRVTIITLSGTRGDVHQPKPCVERIALDLQAESRGIVSAILNNRRRVRSLRKAIIAADPNIVISFTEQMNILALLAARGRRFPLIISERVDPRYHRIGRAWEFLRRRLYRSADRIVVQTQSVADHVRAFSGRAPIEVIANGVDPPTIGLPPMSQRRKVIVAAGRLVEQKGFDLLIEAFASLAERHAEWSLEIYGVGPLEEDLRRQIHSRGLESRIRLAGWTGEFESIVAGSSIFALSSRYEGFPNALLDAMAHGTACVSFACPSGPEVIIVDGDNGLLVEAGNVEMLSASLARLIGDLDLRERLGTSAREVVRQYGTDSFLAAWDALIDDAGSAS